MAHLDHNYHQLILFNAVHQITTLLPVIFNKYESLACAALNGDN